MQCAQQNTTEVVEVPVRKRQHEKSRRKYEDNSEMDIKLKEIHFGNMNLLRFRSSSGFRA
jgi:hypothetical protein